MRKKIVSNRVHSYTPPYLCPKCGSLIGQNKKCSKCGYTIS